MRPRNNLLLITCLLLLTSTLSCYHSGYHYNDADVSVTVEETDNEYWMSATFDESRTRQVKEFISNHIGNNGSLRSGNNIETHTTTIYADNVKVDVKLHPGRLKIKLDKEGNSKEAYTEVRGMCEGIKEFLTNDQ